MEIWSAETWLGLIGLLIGGGGLGSWVTLLVARKKIAAEVKLTYETAAKTSAEAKEIVIKTDLSITEAWRMMANKLGEEWDKAKDNLSFANARIDNLECELDAERKSCNERLDHLHRRIQELEKTKP